MTDENRNQGEYYEKKKKVRDNESQRLRSACRKVRRHEVKNGYEVLIAE